MSIQINSYTAEGPLGNTNELSAASGVYVILGRNSGHDNWNVIDVGESQDVQHRVSNHDRSDCWTEQGYSTLNVAAIYVHARNRALIEQELRNQFTPPCGKR